MRSNVSAAETGRVRALTDEIASSGSVDEAQKHEIIELALRGSQASPTEPDDCCCWDALADAALPSLTADDDPDVGSVQAQCALAVMSRRADGRPPPSAQVSQLAALLGRRDDAALLEQAACTVLALVTSEGNAAAAAAAALAPAVFDDLVALVEDQRTGAQTREAAAAALAILRRRRRRLRGERADRTLSPAFVRSLARMLSKGSRASRDQAMLLLGEVAPDSREACRQIAEDAGTVAALVRAASGPTPQPIALYALASVATSMGDGRAPRSFGQAGCLPAMLALLARVDRLNGPSVALVPLVVARLCHRDADAMRATAADVRAVEALAGLVLTGDSAPPGAREASAGVLIDLTNGGHRLASAGSALQALFAAATLPAPFDAATRVRALAAVRLLASAATSFIAAGGAEVFARALAAPDVLADQHAYERALAADVLAAVILELCYDEHRHRLAALVPAVRPLLAVVDAQSSSRKHRYSAMSVVAVVAHLLDGAASVAVAECVARLLERVADTDSDLAERAAAAALGLSKSGSLDAVRAMVNLGVVRALVKRLPAGDPYPRALWAIVAAASSTGAADVSSTIPQIVQMLRADVPIECLRAVIDVVKGLAGVAEDARAAAVSAGAADRLSELMRTGPPDVRDAAREALRALRERAC